MDPIYRLPPSPGTPLFPISPNRQTLPLMHSPSMPTGLGDQCNDPFASNFSSRASFGVQDKVAQFNNLIKENESPRHRERDAALRRAMLGREEAESDLRRVKEENRMLRRDIEEGKQRELKVGSRLEAVMEDLMREKESMAHAQALYEKQIRQARKEAFKASSTVLKMREEVKTARNQSTLRREEVDELKRHAEQRDQSLFQAQNDLVSLQEDIDAMKHQLEIAEEEKLTLRSTLQEEELARIAAEGKLALPSSRDHDEASDDTEPSVIRRESLKENLDPIPGQSPIDEEVLGEIATIKGALLAEQRLREQAQDSMHFMKMECQLRCCSCRIAERRGKVYLHDDTFDKSQELNASSKRRSPEVQTSMKRSRPNEAVEEDKVMPDLPQPIAQPIDVEPLISFSPKSGTFHTAVSTEENPPLPQPAFGTYSTVRSTTPPSPCLEPHDLSTINESPSQPPPPIATPSTPHHLPISPPSPLLAIHNNTTTLTTRVPIAPLILTPARPATASIPFSPDVTISREEALEQIRQRRGRARSVTAAAQSTPNRHFSGAASPTRRDISAPAKTPAR